MVWIVLITGFLVMTFCLVVLVKPDFLRRIIDFFSIGSRLYLAGFLRLVFGAMLLILATHTRLWGYVVAIGLVASASGLSFFFFALKRTKKLLARLRNQSNLFLRFYATIALAIWALLIYAFLPAVPAFFLR